MSKRPLVVGVAGGTGSGKTTVAHKLGQSLPPGECVTIEFDSYYRDRGDLSDEERADINYDHPDSLEVDLLATHLDALLNGQGVDLPIYDFVSHRRSREVRSVMPAPIIIVEGILALATPELRERFDIKLFVDTDADIRVFRRIRRDLEQRGRTFASVRDRYYRFVRPMHLEFVEPSKRWADIILPEGGNNRVALAVIMAQLNKAVEDKGIDGASWQN